MKTYKIIYSSFGGSNSNFEIDDRIIDKNFKLAKIISSTNDTITVKYVESDNENILSKKDIQYEDDLKKILISNILNILKKIKYAELDSTPETLSTSDLSKISLNLNKLEIFKSYGVGIRVKNNMPISSVSSNQSLNHSQNNMPISSVSSNQSLNNSQNDENLSSAFNNISLNSSQNNMPLSSVSNIEISKHEPILLDLDLDFYKYFLYNQNLQHFLPDYLKFYNIKNYGKSHSLAGEPSKEKPFPLFPILGFLNYSDNPNCYNYFGDIMIGGKLFIIGYLIALRDIEAGEELTTNYYAGYDVFYDMLNDNKLYSEYLQTDSTFLNKENTFLDLENENVKNFLENVKTNPAVIGVPEPTYYIDNFETILSMGDDVNIEYIKNLNPNLKFETYKLLDKIYNNNKNKIKSFDEREKEKIPTPEILVKLKNKLSKLTSLIKNEVFNDTRDILHMTQKPLEISIRNLTSFRNVIVNYFVNPR